MPRRHLYTVSPLIIRHLVRAALEKRIGGDGIAAVVARLEEMADRLLPENGKIFSSLFSGRDEPGECLSPREIGQLFWRERLASQESRRQEGSYYTPEDVIDGILDPILPELVAGGRTMRDATFCDPALGCGFFPLRLVERLKARRIRLDRLRAWAGAFLFGVDTDPAAVFMARALLWLALSDEHGEFRPDPGHFRMGDSLLGPAFGEAVGTDSGAGLDWGKAFPEVGANGGFSVVAGNPPYEVLTNFRRHPDRKLLADALRSCGRYHEALDGQINLYRCFIERGLALTKPGGILSYVVPLSLARDGAAEAMRRRLLLREAAEEWRLYGENERLFAGVTQSICVFKARRGGGRAKRLAVTAAGFRECLNLRELEKYDSGLVIPGLDRDGMAVWRWFHAHCPGRLDDLAEARVGEVDQTVFRACMVEHDTGCLLARGTHVQAFLLDAEVRPEKERFLDLPRFLAMKGRGAQGCRERAERWRVVQLGIRNLHSTPRLIAALAPPGVYLGNSLNVYYPREGVPIAYLAGVLNSAWLDWLFCLGSGNNNINLQEMRELPFPSRVSGELMEEVATAYRVCEKTAAAGGELIAPRAHLNRVVARCYGLPVEWTPDMLRIVL